jgi:cysteine synthase A
VPDDQSREKIELLQACGSDVRVVPAVAFANPENYYHVARRIAQETPGAFWANQFENLANRRAHEATTGPEIWEQTGGRIDAFVAAAGTGGTIAGVASALKSRREDVLTVLCDPMGSALYNYVNSCELKPEGDSDLEGIGIKRLTANFEGAPVDRDSRDRRASDRHGALAARTRGNLCRRLERTERRRRSHDCARTSP